MLENRSSKFSRFISNNAAEPMSPTTTGRNAAKMPFM